jgi:hypothetical protein
MPILHIHEPRESIVAPAFELAIKPPYWYITELHRRGAHLSTLEAGFSGDITPSCLAQIPDMPPASYQIAVDASGESALLTTRLAPGNAVSAVVKWTNSAVVVPDISELRLENNGDTAPLSQSTGPDILQSAIHVGGLVMMLEAQEVPLVTAIFTTGQP